MSVKRFNICVAEKYTTNGAEKTKWNNVGTLLEFTKQDDSVSRMIEIPAIGLKASVFEEKKKDQTIQTQNLDQVQENYKNFNKPAAAIDTIQYPEEELNPNDVLF